MLHPAVPGWRCRWCLVVQVPHGTHEEPGWAGRRGVEGQRCAIPVPAAGSLPRRLARAGAAGEPCLCVWGAGELIPCGMPHPRERGRPHRLGAGSVGFQGSCRAGAATGTDGSRAGPSRVREFWPCPAALPWPRALPSPGTAPRTPEAPRGDATTGLVLRAGTWGLPSAQPVGADLEGRGRGASSCSPSTFPAAHQTHGCPAGCSTRDAGCAGSGQGMGWLPAAENTRKAVRVCGGAGAGCVPRRGLGVGQGSGASPCLQSPHFAPL